MPAPTDFDARFRLLGIPVRINPFFWLVAAYMGWQGHDGVEVLEWVACVFVSILVHEFGHGLTARALTGQQPTVVLYGMGGLCSYEREARSPWQRIAVLLMGPGAGFLLFGLVFLFSATVIGSVGFGPWNHWFHAQPVWVNHLVLRTIGDLIWINLFWGIFNLFPIYPLDGGQIAHTLLTMQNRSQGARRCFILSLVVAGLLAIYLYQQGQLITAFFLAYLGLINFQFLQAAHYQGRHGDQTDEDDDWWKR